MEPKQENVPTRWTLVAGIKNPNDDGRWNEFYDYYRGLVLGVALKAGLREDEAHDVLQETMKSVAQNIGKFEANPARGSFRGWLLTLVRWKINDQFKRRMQSQSNDFRVTAAGSTNVTPTIERVPDPHVADLEAICDIEWKQRLLDRATKELRLEIKGEHYQIFHLLEIEKKPLEQVARMVDRNRAQIYVIKHRAMIALKRIVKRLEKELG